MTSVEEYQQEAAQSMTEAELQRQIVVIAHAFNWRETAFVRGKWYNWSNEIENSGDVGAPRSLTWKGLATMPRKNTTRTCSIEGCDGPVYGRGWCNKHWARWYRYGDPTITLRTYPSLKNRSLSDRFWEKVQTGPECWEWLGAFDGHGYGQLRVDGKARLAHRLSYELTYGSIPSDSVVMHRCDNPACVRPDHLVLGTHKENSRDMMFKGRGKGQFAPKRRR